MGCVLLNEEKPDGEMDRVTKKMTRTRRTEKKKNTLKNMKIMMVNIRGLKCKQQSLAEIIDENNPTILLLMEVFA